MRRLIDFYDVVKVRESMIGQVKDGRDGTRLTNDGVVTYEVPGLRQVVDGCGELPDISKWLNDTMKTGVISGGIDIVSDALKL